MFLSCAAGQVVRTFELSSDAIQPRRSLASQSERVTCARYNHNGRILASGGVDGAICLDVAGSGELLSRFFYPSASPRDRVRSSSLCHTSALAEGSNRAGWCGRVSTACTLAAAHDS